MAVSHFEVGSRYRFYFDREDDPDDFFDFVVTDIRPNRFDANDAREVWGEEGGMEKEVHCVTDLEWDRACCDFLEIVKPVSYEPEDWS